jgi:hypothetical protein
VKKTWRYFKVLLRKPAALLAIALTFVFSLAIALPIVRAQDSNQSQGSGLQLSPTRSDLSGQPGDNKQFSIVLKNITQNEVTAQVFLNDFESDNSSGTPKIIVDNRARTPYSLINMLKGYADIDLKAGETKEIKLSVEIPGDAAPGAYFGALRYAAVPKGQAQTDAQRQVALTASVAHLIFVEVPGNINEQIQIESLKAEQNGKAGTFFLKNPNKIALGVKNLGNGFSRPFGKVNVTGPFGKATYSYDINNTDPRGIILPNSSRTFSDDSKNIKWPGKYNLTASVAYGNGGEVITYKSSFIYMPIWAIVTLVVLILVLAGGIYMVYRKKFVRNVTKKKK